MSQEKKCTVAQLGIGYWGPNLVRNFMQSPRLEQLIACDLDPKRLEMISQKHPGVRTSTDPEAVLQDPSVDAVAIVLPASLHYEWTEKALQHGKHVYVEKPLTVTAEESRKLIALAESVGKKLMVGHTFLYNSAVERVKEYIDSGELGEVYYISAERLNLGRVRSDVNAWWNLAPHDVSIILYWLNELPSSYMARGHVFLQDGIEDVVFADLQFPSGKAAHIQVSWLHPQKTRKFIVVGSKKMLVYDDVATDAKITLYDKGVDKKNIIRDLPDIQSFGDFQLQQRTGDTLMPRINFVEPLATLCRHFIDCVLDDLPPKTGGADGLAVVEVMEQVEHLLRANRKGA